MTFKLVRQKPTLVITRERTLYIARQYLRHPWKEIDDFDVIYNTFIGVYVYQYLFKYRQIWQSYYKNKMVQFFCPTV